MNIISNENLINEAKKNGHIIIHFFQLKQISNTPWSPPAMDGGHFRFPT